MALKITVNNYSKKEWNRWDWSTSGIDWDATVNQGPSKSLIAHAGMTTASAKQLSSTGFSQGYMNMQLGYNSGGNYAGVSCQTHVQVIGIGKGCSWKYLDAKGKWVDVDQDPTPVTIIVGAFKVTYTPTLDHHDASVSVLIQNL